MSKSVKEPTVQDVLAGAVQLPSCEYQFLHECALGVKSVKAKKDIAAYNRVEFATRRCSPKDIAFPSKADFVGVVIWIPMADYKKLSDPK